MPNPNHLVRTLFALSLCLLSGGLALFVEQPPAVYAQDSPTPLPLYALPDGRTNPVFVSSSIAFNDVTRVLLSANMMSNTVSVVAPLSGELQAEIPVGNDPRSVATTPDGVRALVTNRGDSTLSVVDLPGGAVSQTIPLGGAWAYGIVSASNEQAFVSMQGSAEVVVVDLVAGAVAARIPTPPHPTGLALWGDFLYVTHLWSGDVSLIYVPQQQVVSTISTGQETGMSPGLDIDTTRGLAYLPQTRSYATNPALTYDSVVIPEVNVLRLTGLSLQRAQRITLDTAVRPVNMPFAVQIDPFRRWAYVANAGSNDVSVIELQTGRARANIEVGANPRSLLLNGDNSRLYVHNVIDGTISIIDTSTFNTLDTIPVSTELAVSVDVLIGAELFHTAADPRLSTDAWVSCANCHLDGMSDGRVWLDFPAGERNTPTMFDLTRTAPYNWDASWDELADAELKIRALQAGIGLLEGGAVPNAPLGDPHAGLSLDLDALALYMETLQGPVSPHTADAALLERGRAIYEEQSCNTCHVLPVGTDGQAYDVGTGGTFDTPTVNWLWLSAPYFHDGRARTLADVFAQPGAHQLQMTLPPEDIDALIAYLLSLPSDEVSAN